MTHRCALHRRFHRAWTAAGADVQLAQTQLGTHATGIEVFGFINGVTTPAHDHAWGFAYVQGAGVTQNGEDQVGNMGRAFQVQMLETTGVTDLAIHKQNVAQHGKQVGLQRTNNAPVNKGIFRRVNQLQLHATFTAQDVNIKAFKAGQQLFAVVSETTGVQNGK